MQPYFWCFLFLFSFICSAQYSYSGFVNPEDVESPIYLSLVEDYRKLDGAYAEQILSRTHADSTGFFQFRGNLLDTENRIYRIHIDKCSDERTDMNHFNGFCTDSEAFLFIANNSDTLNLPFSFGNQIFCAVESSNPNANAFLKIDSLKQDMKFAYGEFRSEANRKLNNKKWFKTLQDYGKSLNEPLAELYIYAYLSDRSSDLYSHYVEDLRNNNYYDGLLSRLEVNYPQSPYTTQYTRELAADRYMLGSDMAIPDGSYDLWLVIMLVISLALNIWLAYSMLRIKKRQHSDLKESLSRQEKVVLEQLLLDKSNKEIAKSLFLSVSTIKTHTNNIYKKLKVQSREEVKSLFIK
jgi:DNA-binding CsgD family transcriptional regulator